MGNVSTPSECNQEATVSLLIQMPSQAHLLGNTSPDYQYLPQFLSVCKSFKTIFYPLPCVSDHHVFHWAVIGIDTTHPQAVYLLEDSSLD